VLAEEFLKPMGLSQNRLAAVGVSFRRIDEIALGKRAITADAALRALPGTSATRRIFGLGF
jgi:plasmid maintenance system antidote protein VapI